MYFIYSKTINIASEINYPTQNIINFFIDNFTPIEDYFDECGVDTNSSEFISYIFETSDTWFDSFCNYIGLEENVLNNMYEDDIINQISDAVGDDLFDYFTKHWDEYLKEYLTEYKESK